MTKYLFNLITFCSLISCGDLFMKNKEDASVELSQLATCELDTEAFSYILEQNIKGDIQCLGENLNLFMDIVKTDRPGFVSKTILKKFLLTGPMDIEAKTVDLIDSVFDLSYLILGGEKDYIKRADVTTLLNFLEFFNEHIRKIYGYFSSDDVVGYWRHVKERKIIFAEMALISNELQKIYKNERESFDVIDIEKFIITFLKDDIDLLNKIRSVLFIKRAFLGGTKIEMSYLEFGELLKKLPKLSEVAFDVLKTQNLGFDDTQKSLISIFLNDISILKDLFFYKEDSVVPIFNIYDLINAIQTLVPDALGFDLSKFPREIIKIKEIVIADDSEDFTGKNLYDLLSHADDILSEAHLFYRVYEANETELNGPQRITRNFSDFPVYTSRDEGYLKNFARIAGNYKFIKGSNPAPFYTHDYKRNANAFFEVSAIEYLVRTVFKYYGQANPKARGGFDITLDQTVQIIHDFKWFLRDQGIINIGRKGGGEIEGVADNFVLMSTLFQYQSDGCGDASCMEVPETTEFLIGMFTALQIKDFFSETMMSFCRAEQDQFGRIAPDCFRRNFINVLEVQIPEYGKSLSDYMPFLHKSLKDMTSTLPEGAEPTASKDYMKFLTETESFTRACRYYDNTQSEEVYLKASDAFAVFAGLLNIESAILRFDINQNNKLDGVNGTNEVLNAYYEVYEGAIKALVAPDGGFMEKLAKPIFLYLIKYEKVPETSGFGNILQFAKFLLTINKKSDATRTTFATILKTIGEQSPGAAEHPYKCEECLRDPNKPCEPEGDDWL